MIRVYGASDDLIEIEGDIREEFNVYGEGVHHLVFDDGTVLSLEYTDDDFWKIERIAEGTAAYDKGFEYYNGVCGTEVVTLDGNINYVGVRTNQ